MTPLWLDIGSLCLCLFSEKPFRTWGVGLRVSVDEPALDVFFLWWMVSLTTVAHRRWIAACGAEHQRVVDVGAVARAFLYSLWGESGNTDLRL